jgi:hypothetical protein
MKLSDDKSLILLRFIALADIAHQKFQVLDQLRENDIFVRGEAYNLLKAGLSHFEYMSVKLDHFFHEPFRKNVGVWFVILVVGGDFSPTLRLFL